MARLFNSCGLQLSNKRPITANIIMNGNKIIKETREAKQSTNYHDVFKSDGQ